MKKLSIVVCILCWVCIAFGTEVQAFGENDVTLTLAIPGFDSGTRTHIEALLKEDFAEKYPNIKVETVLIPNNDWGDYFTKIKTMMAAGNAPDVARVAIEGIQMMAEKNMALPLNSYIEAHPEYVENYDDLHPNLQRPFVLDDKIYGLTWDWNNMVTHINLDMLEDAGLPFPDENWGTEEFLKYAKALTREVDGQKIYGCALPPFYFGMESFLYNFNAAVLTDDMSQSALDSPEAREAFQFFHDLIYKYQVAPIPDINPTQMMINRQVAMVFAGRWPIAGWKENNLHYDIQYIPSFKTNQVIFGSGAWPVMKTTKHPEEAYILAAYLCGVKSQSSLKEVHIPTRISVMEKVLPKSPPRNTMLYRKSADIARAVQSPPEYPEISEIFMRYFNAIMTDAMTIEDGLKAAHEEINAVLSE